MIELDMKEKKYLQVSKHFQQINTTPIVTKHFFCALVSFYCSDSSMLTVNTPIINNSVYQLKVFNLLFVFP